ncbi:FAD-dependent oxidoreductase [Thalassobaculum sp.]|uniref:NAD(P)/FAD-dependent oxidoreductase n=1 Tax=Thalassobaculum sp. TaxID=2022740 RepID=UPI0032ED9EF1
MRIAVIGSGIAGLSAAWLLSSRHDVTLYEKDARLGGHANTLSVEYDGARIDVDTGFIVYNEITYPNLVQMFRQLDVATEASDMGFGVSVDDGRLEYAGSLRGLLAQPGNLTSPRYWRMIADMLRFFRSAADLLREPGPGPSLGEWLAREGYSEGFVEDHLLPMGAAIWSCPVGTMLDFPARSFVQFFQNHQLLNLVVREPWRTVTGGSKQYVARLATRLTGRIRLSSPVRRVVPDRDGVTVACVDGDIRNYDHVVLATHGDQALRLIAEPTAAETAVLGCFRYQPNTAILHRDTALMPRRRAAWSAWNYQAERAGARDRRVALTYWMNRLQNLDPARPLFVSMNPLREPDPAKVFACIAYEHPVFDAAAIAAQDRLPEIQGSRRLWFCGSYAGWGFHEDGLKSAIAVALSLGARLPWPSAVTPASVAAGKPAATPVLADAAD